MSSSAGTDAGLPYAGLIELEQDTAGYAEIYAQFQEATSDFNPACATTTVGACTFSSCGPDAGIGPAGVSAGTITVTGGDLASPVSLSDPGGDDEEYVDQLESMFFAPGQTLTASASGGVVPAFGPVSVVAPAYITLTAPVVVSGAVTIPTTSDLSVSWTGGQPGAVVYFQSFGATQGQVLNCAFDATAGSGTIPAAVMAPLEGAAGAVLIWAQGTSETITAGSYVVTESAIVFGTASVTYE